MSLKLPGGDYTKHLCRGNETPSDQEPDLSVAVLPNSLPCYNLPVQKRDHNLQIVTVGLILAVVLDTILQISWKLAVSGIPDNASMATTAIQAFSGVYFYLAMFIFAAQFFNWMRVLSHADLSFAQPFTALSYITVLALSSHFLHEKIASLKVLGVAMIILGAFLISQTPHRTTPYQSLP